MTADNCEFSANKFRGVTVMNGGHQLTLVRSACNDNGMHGFNAHGQGSGLAAEHSCALGNKEANAVEEQGGSITCHECDLGGQAVMKV